MTYKQMTKQINEVEAQIRFLYSVQKNTFANMKDEQCQVGNIINNLLAYKYYLMNEKKYNDITDYERTEST